ncbi:tRNA pseudouridine(13) synthase TruD [Candidatus Uhrbacteria bacterium]|nr:tRNA pseudouridine(13) synthase TruD [Candidatus Uhrbacteria bacterium]
MPDQLISHLREQEHALVEAIRAEHPERVERMVSPDPDIILGRIGITYLSPARPSGYIKLFAHDFLVEEVSRDGSIVSLSHASPFESNEDERTLWADLIKANISGFNATNDLAHLLKIEPGQIGFAGIKDAVAVTSQRVSLRGVKKELAETLEHEHMMLRPVRYGNGAIQPGELSGNRFTIVVRTAPDQSIDTLMKQLGQDGFLNFFGSQRFGPRLIAQRLGQKLLQDDTDGALQIFFGEPGLFDVPLYHDLRKALGEAYGDWGQMLAIAENFPFTLSNEIKVLKALQRDPMKTRLALAQIQEQVKMWVYGYGSWVVNRYLSELVEQGKNIPDEIPLALMEQGLPPEYQHLFEHDGTENYLEQLKKFPYVQAAKRGIPGRIKLTDLKWQEIPQGWVVRFSLPKGAYATSCLSHMFRLYSGWPIPEWVKKEEVDALAAVENGTIAPLREKFASVLERPILKEEAETTN